MKVNIKYWMRNALVSAVAATSFSCGSEFTQSASPVELVVTNEQEVFTVDLAGGAGCDESFGTIELRAILKNPSAEVDQRFNDVRISRYRVSYARTDGGTIVPAPFVRSADMLVPAGGSP